MGCGVAPCQLKPRSAPCDRALFVPVGRYNTYVVSHVAHGTPAHKAVASGLSERSRRLNSLKRDRYFHFDGVTA
jgi:hypothetical protein